MRTDLHATLHIIAWGRPTVRGELDPHAHVPAVYRNLRSCTFESSRGRFEDCTSFFAELRAQDRLPAFDGKLGLSAQADHDAESFQSSLELVRREGHPPIFDMKFVTTGVASIAREHTLADATSMLEGALDGLVHLGARANLGGWERIFGSALSTLRGQGQPSSGLFLPSATPVAIVHLLNAAMQADVFGGMGSWNDFEPLPDDAEEDERSLLSGSLSTAIDVALRAGASSI
jgi:hypothetical protein